MKKSILFVWLAAVVCCVQAQTVLVDEEFDGIQENGKLGAFQMKNYQEEYSINTDNMNVRDPFIFVDEKNKSYYLHINTIPTISVYKSKDLKKWGRVGHSEESKRLNRI